MSPNLHRPTPPPSFTLDTASHPTTFQAAWQSNPDPTALPFPRSNPPFALTDIDWQQLSLPDSQFTPHSWTNLQHLISTNQLAELKRWPSALKAYLAWTMHVKEKYGSATAYLLNQRLFWTPQPQDDGALVFETESAVPFGSAEDYTVLRNDWAYGLDDGIAHVVVWLKGRLPVDEQGRLSEEGREAVEGFVDRMFRERCGEEGRGSKVLWFKNTVDLQSVRGLEHVHVLVRGVGEDVLGEWMV